MTTKLKFLWVLLALMVGGVNGVWANEVYIVTSDGTSVNTSTGTTTFMTATTYQATEHVQLYIGSAWNISSGKISGTAQPANGNGTYNNESNYFLPTSGSYLIITPSQNGSITVNGSKNSGGNKYLQIQTSNTNFISDATVTCGGNTCTWTSGRNGYNVSETSGNIVATFGVQSGTTYYVFFNQFNDWSFTGFTFTKQKIDVADSDFGFMYVYRNIHSGDTYEGNPLVNRLNLPVTYSSSNTSAATINSNTGETTIQTVNNGIQSTTITAHFAGNDDYNAKDVTYSLNVAPALVYRDISVAHLRYQPGVNGISGTKLDRSVGGFDLTFGENEGIKCNNTNNFYFRTNGSGAKGSMTIALDASNSSGDNYIKKIVFTAWGTPSLSVNSVAKTSGTLIQTGASEWTWTQYYDNVRTVTFTSQGENDESILISNIRVYTNSLPTFTKVTPVPGFSRNSDSFSTGASVNISDLSLSTSPSSFLFDYTYAAGTTTLTHTPYTTNTTWPGTITGTAADGTATIAASFSDSSNPFFNTVSSTNVYTLTVSSVAKNTFVWDFTQALSAVDAKLLEATSDTWVLTGSNWTPTGGTTISGPFSQNGIELEYVYGLELYNSRTDDKNTLIYGNGGGFRLNSGDGRYIRIPNLKAGDKVTVLCNNYSANRGLSIPSNITNATATGWGNYNSTGEFICVGYVNIDGNVDLYSTSAMDVKKIIVESTNHPWPTLSFANGSSVNTEIPYDSSNTTYTNALTSVPTGATVTYSILLDENAGGASAASINSSTGEIAINATGKVIVRATVTAGTYNSAYYCDYILNATIASEYASWTYSADSKEIDGEVRPYQGTVTFTGSGKIDDTNRVITDVPGITLTIGASGEDWNVVNNASVGLAAYNANSASTRPSNFTTGCYYTFVPTVNGYLNLNVDASGWSYIYKNGTQISSQSNKTGDWGEVMLVAGYTYVFCKQNDGAYLHGFTFRPAFLTPDETAEQTATFEAYSSTTEFPKLVHSSDAGVRFSGNRSVVNLSSDGGVTLVGGGTAIVRGKVISGENTLTAYYTLNANVLSLTGTNPTSGSTIISLDNSVFQFLFDQDIQLLDATKFVVLKDATDITSSCTIALNTNTGEADYQKRLNVSGFGTLEAGSTYTIRLLADAVAKSDNATIKNAEVIGTFTVESTEPPLTWIYPSTTSAVRIGTSIVLQTSAKIDEGYPSNGVWGTLTYDGDDGDADYPMTLKAIKDDDKLVFKATKPMVSNKLYTLTIGANQVKLSGSSNMITKDKVFLFTTGTGTGASPVLVSSTPSGDTAIDKPSSSSTVDIYFDQNVELEPYTNVSITPVNGDETLANGTSEKMVNGVLTAQTLTVDGENQKHISFVVGSDIKYDLYYEMVIPANTVTGPGGMPNNAYTVRFKINPRSGVSEVTPATFYPHTWDFCKLGNSSTSSSSAYKIIQSAAKQKDNSTKFNGLNTIFESSEDGYTTYKSKASDNNNLFDDGNNVYIRTSLSNTESLPEFEGVRISLKKPNSGRFEIRNVTSKETANKNLDDTDKWIFRLNGNTHYMTLSNVPAGKLYMVVNTPYLGINSPNATFESVSGSGYTLSNNNTLLNTNGTKKVVINVEQAGDVSFCVQNFNCEKIAVAEDEKTFRKEFAENGKTYATDRLGYDVRYDLLNAFTDHNVKPYYVSAMTNNESDNTATFTATEVNPANAVKGDQGVIAVYQSALSADATVPVFKTDVNTAPLDASENGNGTTVLKNLLKVGETGSTALPTVDEDKYLYVLSYQGSKSSGIGFYRYVGTTFSDRAAYLAVDKSWVEPSTGSQGAARALRIVFVDADDSQTTLIRDIETEGVSEVGGRPTDYYDLRGLRLSRPVKPGLYIKDGRKVYVK